MGGRHAQNACPHSRGATSFPHIRTRDRDLPVGMETGLAGVVGSLCSIPLGCTCHSCPAACHTSGRKSQHLPCLGECLEGVTKVSCNKPGMLRGPKHPPQVHARPTMPQTRTREIQTTLEMWNHFKTQGFSVLHLTIASPF